ncbi:hypothetical protein EDB84DRAFT_1563839 [Lactarius hengduanensis]|nr:hypothetical protein EDB84DRAFT_1563839 [Lactarius hengduanensis]
MSQSTPSNDESFRPLTLGEKLWLVPIFLKLPFAIAVGIFRGNKGRSWSRSANVALTRYIFNHDWDIHAMRSFIGVTYVPDVPDMGSLSETGGIDGRAAGGGEASLDRDRDGMRAITRSSFTSTVRGGYVLPAGASYFPFLHSLQKALSADIGEVGVVALEYSLAPDSPVPTQLRQANAGPDASPPEGHPSVEHRHRRSRLTSSTRLPSIPAPPTLTQPLAGAVLISPWVAYSVDAPSYARNEGKDLLFSRSYKFMADLHEGLFDQIIDVSRIIGQHVKDTTTVIEPGGLHEDMIFNLAYTQNVRAFSRPPWSRRSRANRAVNCVFIPAPSLELPSLQYDKAFTDEIGHSGTWNGEALEDFAVRTVTTVRSLSRHRGP